MLKDKIRQQYRVRLILDNLPITTYDLELDPESGECWREGWVPGWGRVDALGAVMCASVAESWARAWVGVGAACSGGVLGPLSICYLP